MVLFGVAVLASACAQTSVPSSPFAGAGASADVATRMAAYVPAARPRWRGEAPGRAPFAEPMTADGAELRTTSSPATASASVAPATLSTGPRSDVFGGIESISDDLRAFGRVSAAVNGTLAELAQADECKTSFWTRCPVTDWKRFLGRLRGKDTAMQLKAVNLYINRARYVSDQRNYGIADKWATAGQLFDRGGDCEDYVIAKYVSLRELGVPIDAMRMVVVYDRVRRIAHAILLIETADGVHVLDNQSPYVLRPDQVSAYRPIYSVNENNWWIHQTPRRAAGSQIAAGKTSG